MVLIIGQDELDMPTDLVFNWVHHFGIQCQKISGTQLLQQDNSLSISTKSRGEDFTWQSGHIALDKVDAVWMRRWISMDYFDQLNDTLNNPLFLELLSNDLAGAEVQTTTAALSEIRQIIIKELVAHRRNEFKCYSHYFFELLSDVPTLGHSFLSAKDPSKAHQMRMAKKVGLSVPDTLITNCKKDLVSFAAKNGSIICKNIGEVSALYYYRLFVTYTSLVNPEFINGLPDHFFTSIFQKAIDKEFEIRVFYLNGELYSMAIFSSQDPQTKIDFRMYNAERPNRTVPIKLPLELEEKVIQFMNAVQLSTGSLDFIFSTDGLFYFLEVNPVGQFGMVSYPCNYYLEKRVAQQLIKLSGNASKN